MSVFHPQQQQKMLQHIFLFYSVFVNLAYVFMFSTDYISNGEEPFFGSELEVKYIFSYMASYFSGARFKGNRHAAG